MRTLILVALLVNGLVPSFAQMVEIGVHGIVTGHLALVVKGEGDPKNQGSDRDCGSAAQLCECCSTVEATPPVLAEHAPNAATFGRIDRANADPHTEDHARRLFRPPTAS